MRFELEYVQSGGAANWFLRNLFGQSRVVNWRRSLEVVKWCDVRPLSCPYTPLFCESRSVDVHTFQIYLHSAC